MTEPIEVEVRERLTGDDPPGVYECGFACNLKNRQLVQWDGEKLYWVVAGGFAHMPDLTDFVRLVPETQLAALTRQLAELQREHDIIQEQFHATDDALCKIGDLALQVSDHFNDDGSLKGDGKWRLNEIAKCCWAIVEAEKPVAAAHTKAREKPSLRSQLAEARQEVERLKEASQGHAFWITDSEFKKLCVAAGCHVEESPSVVFDRLPELLTAAQAALKAAEERASKAEASKEFTDRWYACRIRWLEDFFRGEGRELPIAKQFWNIIANGTPDHVAPPTYQQLLNAVTHRAEAAEAAKAAVEKERDAIRERLDKNHIHMGRIASAAIDAGWDESDSLEEFITKLRASIVHGPATLGEGR